MILLEKEYTFTPKNTDTDEVFTFQCPEGVQEIHIYFSFAPDVEENCEICKPQIDKAIASYYAEYAPELQPMEWNKYMPIKNLITISLDHEGVYIGNAHRWRKQQEHILRTDFASLGFCKPQKLEGTWKGMLHLHEIISPECNAMLRVEGVQAC